MSKVTKKKRKKKETLKNENKTMRQETIELKKNRNEKKKR